MEEKVVVKRPPKSPTLAGLLAFFLPTTGALYNGQFLKFVVYVIIFAGLVTMQPTEEAQPFAGLILAGFCFYQFFEAIQTSKRINRRALLGEEEEEEKIEEIPEVIKTGSVFWGIILLILGGLLLLANFAVISYGLLFDFWPLVVIVIGAKLIADYLSKNKTEKDLKENTHGEL